MATPKIALTFPSNAAAERLIAGIPVAVRAALLLPDNVQAPKGCAYVLLTTPEGLTCSQELLAEWHRVLPRTGMETGREADLADQPEVAQYDAGRLIVERYLPESGGEGTLQERQTRLAVAKAILKETGKASDGLVSSCINRPMSRSISAVLLRWPCIKPIHVTWAVAMSALVMLAALLTGTKEGAIAGALLFQFASMLDGVDGEIARATFRSSELGATLDSLTDTATNLFFIAGLSWNLFARSETLGAFSGAAAMGILAIGLLLLGIHAKRTDGHVHFDAIKRRVGSSPTRKGRFLAKLAGRDTYAFVLAAAVLLGIASEALAFFTLIVAIWLVIVVYALLKGRPAALENE